MDTKALRQKILDLAIRGKLVPQDPNDEPASVLLDRIREQKKQMVKEGKLKAKDIKNDSVIFVGEDSLHYEKFADGSMKCIEDEIPFELPEGWVWSRLHSLTIKIGAGSTPTGGAAVYTTSGIKFIRSQNVYDYGLILDDVAYISEEINQKKSGSIVKPKDILLNITGGSIGRCALVPDDFDIANVNQHVMIIRLSNLEVRKYIHSVITSPYIQEQIMSRQVGSGRGGLSAETLSTFLIPLPPLNEQESIIGKLNYCISKVLTITDEQCNITDLITRAKSKILDLAIRGQLVPQDPADEPASVLLERIRAEKEKLIKQGKIKRDKKESVIFRGEDNSYYEIVGKNKICIDEKTPFELPDGWTWIRLRNITQFIRNGASIKQYGDASGLPITRIETISAGEIDRNRFGYADILEIGKYESYVMEDYDILMSHINSPKHLGKCALYRHTDNEVLIHGMNLLSIRPVLCELAEYLCVVFRSNYFKDFVWENMKQAVNQASITTTSISEFLLPMPPYKELKQIIKKSNRMSNIIDIISEELS